jgi:cation channel sperm-associated protein 1
MIMAVLDFVLLQLNSISSSFYSHGLFRILKVFKSMRALRALRVLRRLRSVQPSCSTWGGDSKGKRPRFPRNPQDLLKG